MIVGEAAKASRLPVKTVRYYEQIGLVVPDRLDNGYRDYSEDQIKKLAFVQRARSLGFTIEDCRILLSLYEDKSRKSRDVKEIATRHLDKIEKKISELENMRDTLKVLVKCCKGNERPDCPVLEGLSGEGEGA